LAAEKIALIIVHHVEHAADMRGTFKREANVFGLSRSTASVKHS